MGMGLANFVGIGGSSGTNSLRPLPLSEVESACSSGADLHSSAERNRELQTNEPQARLAKRACLPPFLAPTGRSLALRL